MPYVKTVRVKTVRVRPYFKWFNSWIGLYYDVKERAIYIGIVPMIGIKVELPETKRSRKHYLIIGKHINEPIGCCSEDAIEDVLKEEPGSTFVEVDPCKCPVCNEED